MSSTIVADKPQVVNLDWPEAIRTPHVEFLVRNLASLGALEDTLAHIARLDSCAPWDLVEANLRTLQDWAAESPSTRLRIRVLRCGGEQRSN